MQHMLTFTAEVQEDYDPVDHELICTYVVFAVNGVEIVKILAPNGIDKYDTAVVSKLVGDFLAGQAAVAEKSGPSAEWKASDLPTE